MRAIIFTTLALTMLAPTHTVFSQTSREEFVAWAKSQAIPLSHLDPDPDTTDLQPLKQMIGPTRVVALGEPAHGMHEPLAFRNRLFQFLVEQQGFTAIALEVGFDSAQSASDFIAGGPTPATQIGQLRNQENEDLINWMRAYNTNPNHPHKLHIYGIDLSLGGLGNAFPTSRPIKQALAFLAQVDPPSAATLHARFDPFLPRLPGPGNQPPSFSPADHDALTASIEDLIAILDRQRIAFTASSSTDAYDRALRNALMARQADHLFRTTAPDMLPGKIPPDAWIPTSLRDCAMADNILWALNQEGPKGRLLVYAHNAHVKNAPTQGGVWAAFDHPPTAMGEYLRQSLGQNLLIIGTSSAKSPAPTPAPAPTTSPSTESLDTALLDTGHPSFLLDLRAAHDNPATWLAQPKTLTANLDTFFILPPSLAFDILFFTNDLTPNHPTSAH